jgi:hypothetical protein
MMPDKPRFDPMTGKPLLTDMPDTREPIFDPMTGKPLLTGKGKDRKIDRPERDIGVRFDLLMQAVMMGAPVVAEHYRDAMSALDKADDTTKEV